MPHTRSRSGSADSVLTSLKDEVAQYGTDMAEKFDASDAWQKQIKTNLEGLGGELTRDEAKALDHVTESAR